MSNRSEIRMSQRKLAFAKLELQQVKALPRRVGQKVLWSNGVVWTRVGDNDWRADTLPDISYSSAHVASFDWVLTESGEQTA